MELGKEITPFLEHALQHEVRVESFKPVGGGCISHGGRLVTSTGDFFVKWNEADQYPAMFETEAEGLQLLAHAGGARIPRVIGVTARDSKQFIILEWISSSARGRRYWSDLGRGLAAIHKISHEQFGLDHNNYIGSLPQSNRWHTSWSEFFVEERLQPQLSMLQHTGDLSHDAFKEFEGLYGKLERYFPNEPPCLIHGDLWNGNLMTDERGGPCLIDPAVYYGHREAELAFTMLFGGFDAEFYDTYQEVYPLQPGFDDRVDLYNVYPLLVHANLFGAGYLRQALSNVSRYL